MKLLRIIVFAGLASFCAFAQTKPAATSGTGLYSYYSHRYNGRITAGGKRFNNSALTAAHRTYPMGTKLRLTNVANNKSVDVVVNDRGPFVKGREISVTRRAAGQLGFVRQGIATVKIEEMH